MTHRSPLLRHVGIAAAFLSLTLIFTYPIFLHITTMVLGDGHDSMLWLGWFGWYGEAFSKGYPLLNDTQQFYPHGVNLLTYVDGFSLYAIFAVPLILTGQYILAYNVVSILSIWLSAFTAYLMSYDLLRSRISAVFCGLAFGFGGFQMAHALGHLSIFGPFWLPLLVLALNRLVVRSQETAGFALLAGIFFVLTCLTNGYTAILAILVASFYFLLWTAPRILHVMRVHKLRFRAHLLPIAAFAVPLLGLLLLLFELRLPLQPPWGPLEYANGAASPLDYLLPSFLHPVFGPLLLKFYATFPFSPFRWGNLVERDLYLGITPLILATYALIVKRNSTTTKFALIATGFVVLSLGPIQKIFGFYNNTIPYDVLAWLPFFRAARDPARLGLGALLFVSLISSIGMNHLLAAKSLKRGRGKVVVIILIAVLLFEIIPIPYPVSDPTPHSGPVYAWLSTQTGAFGVLEYPITYLDSDAGYHVLIARKSTTSGFVNVATPDLTAYLSSISFLQPNATGELRPVNVTLLRTLNIRYILIHKDNYVAEYGSSALDEALAEANATLGLRFVSMIGDTMIYEVIPVPYGMNELQLACSSDRLVVSRRIIHNNHASLFSRPGYMPT
jgi:hypothetical protein